MIFLTGSTGFLGRELLGRMLVTSPDKRICLLVRGDSQDDAEHRTSALLAEVFGAERARDYRDRIEVVCGDLTADRFGLGDARFMELGERIEAVYHSAATTKLNEDLALSRTINVGGTLQALALARHAAAARRDFRFFHVSTAYVAGNTERVVTPEELDLGRSFRNSYERTKAEAEAEVRAASGDIHTCIFRPSIIVGDSVTGEASAFNVLYVPLRFMVKGLFKALPARPHIPFDVVPVDYVADAILALSAKELASGACFHLSAGLGRESSPVEIIELVFKTFNNYCKEHLRAPGFIAPELLARAVTAAAEGLLHLEKRVCGHLNVFRQTLPFIPYMLSNPRFDTRTTVSHLDEKLIPPLFNHYAERIFRYCFETNWGRKPWTNPLNLAPWPTRLLAT